MRKMNLFLTTLIALTLFISVPAFAKKGFWGGIELNYGIVSFSTPNTGSITGNSLYGLTLLGEYNFTNTLGIAFGIGFQGYTFDWQVGTSTIKYTNVIADIPVTFRVRPMPWFSDTNFTFFVGAGVDYQYSMTASFDNNGTTGKGTFNGNFGIILETGIGYYFESSLIHLDFRYNIGTSDISDNSSGFTPSYLKFSLGYSIKM